MKPLLFTGLDSAMLTLNKMIREEGTVREARGSIVRELPYPITFGICRPENRLSFLEARKGNWFLPYSEALWLLRGSNRLLDGPGHYVKSLFDYSDDGVTWRAGYGPRIRGFDGRNVDYFGSTLSTGIDQLRFVVESIARDPNTRQAVITIGDPNKDCFTSDHSLIKTKDMPCTRAMQFMVVNGKLNMYVSMRSNDLFFGFSQGNFGVFVLLMQVVSVLTGYPIGTYWHTANSLHVYDWKEELSAALLGVDVRAVEDVERHLSLLRGEPTAPVQTDLENIDFIFQQFLLVEEKAKKGDAVMDVDRTASILAPYWPFLRDWLRAIVFKNRQMNKQVTDDIVFEEELVNRLAVRKEYL